MLAPVAWRTPPRGYGPWELVASLLTEGLVARGHDVTLFATADSVTAAELDAVALHGYAEDPGMDGRVWESLHIAHALRRSAEFDLVHSHLDWLPLTLIDQWQAPLVTTVHGFSDPRILPAYLVADSNYVSISDSDRADELSYVATVHHGIDLGEFTPAERAGDDLIALGRIHPDKGTADAIAIAHGAGRRLVLCGPIADDAYFAERIRPHLDDDRVVYLGTVGPEERSRVLGSAAALLHPVQFAEPFGLAVIEAMACGTPVIATRRGSMPEVIDDGITGYLVHTVAEAIGVVPAAAELDRRIVRATAERRFGVDRMVEGYLAVYRDILSR
jgi:glycosyltransferase involved in cell wall biosynthesis